MVTLKKLRRKREIPMPSNDTQLINALVRRHVTRRPSGRQSFFLLPFRVNQYVVPDEIQQLIKIKAGMTTILMLKTLPTIKAIKGKTK